MTSFEIRKIIGVQKQRELNLKYLNLVANKKK